MIVTLTSKKTQTVSSLEEASNAVRKYISDNGLRSSQYSGGLILEDDKVIARVSYNGRVWDGDYTRGDCNCLSESWLPWS